MTQQKDKIQGIKVLLKVNGEWKEVVLDEQLRKMLWKIIDRDGRIKLKSPNP